ncbi:general secretion pathway protein H [Calothrix parasitica NIES-267]|uniref:General secretion pathway protein H n=1 Tax=Calothrix parasitica NIES-267 TaxID=1973488 RepID=A0A1Z4LNP4_9CYAN|nr:general secretion pathway protein H [Calothrix parasitica NIES-267]
MESQNKLLSFSIFKKQIRSYLFYSISALITGGLIIVGKLSEPSCACVDSGDGIAKTYAGIMNRAQHARYIEKKSFANSFDKLETGISSETPHHRYSVRATPKAAFSYAVAKKESNNQKSSKYKSFVGATFVYNNAEGESITVTIICKSDTSGSIQLPEPILQNNLPTCPVGTSSLGHYTFEVKREDNYQ